LKNVRNKSGYSLSAVRVSAFFDVRNVEKRDSKKFGYSPSAMRVSAFFDVRNVTFEFFIIQGGGYRHLHFLYTHTPPLSSLWL
jgi:hypothetical protein